LKILITGKSNFLSKELYDYFSKTNEIIFISKNDKNSIDLTDSKQVQQFFKQYGKFDFIFHTAIKGGKRNIKDDITVLTDNLLMYQNLTNNSHNYNYLFNFCSGAALREQDNSVNNSSEEKIFNVLPSDYYGLSKNVISREISKTENVFNFRLFGCFGKYEENSRLFKSLLINIKNNTQPIIHQDKLMDYISATDVANVLKFYMSKNQEINILPKDVNLVYDKKLKLTEMYELLKTFTDSKLCCKVIDENFGTPYTGSSIKLYNLGIQLQGLDKSLMELKQHVVG